LGEKKVPVHVATGLTPEQMKRLRIMDNRSHELASWDSEMLYAELASLPDISFTGFDAADLEKLELNLGLNNDGAAPSDPGESPAGKKGKKKADQQQPVGLEFKVIVDCTGEEHQAELLAQFKTSGLTCRPLIS
jgi:hypothetical protein